MNFELSQKISEKLESNLQILQNSAEFINETHERTGNYGGVETHGVFTSLKQALIVYIECEGNKEKLEKLIQDMEEIANNPPRTIGIDRMTGNTLIELINAPHIYIGEKYLTYNVEADRILKEIEVQISVLCNEFSIEKPKDVSTGEFLQGFQSNIKHLEQAFNVVKAIKSITD